jgi:hypothetical protein
VHGTGDATDRFAMGMTQVAFAAAENSAAAGRPPRAPAADLSTTFMAILLIDLAAMIAVLRTVSRSTIPINVWIVRYLHHVVGPA